VCPRGDLNPSLVSYIGLHRGTSGPHLICGFAFSGGVLRASTYIQIHRRQYHGEYHGSLDAARGPPG